MPRPRTLWASLLALCLLASPASAGPPEPEEPSAAGSGESGVPAEQGTSGDPSPSVAPLIIDEGGGFWLSVELIGPRGAQVKAARALAEEPVVAALPRGGRPPAGELVGRVETLDEALRWVEQNAFGAAPVGFDGPPSEGAAPIPGGHLLEDHELYLTGLVVTAGAGSGGTREYPWPPAALLPLPEGSDWRPAELAGRRAPLFAAPAPSLPPAAERYAVVEFTDDLWIIGLRDQCDEGGDRCLRWAQVLTRSGDRFRGGWLPAYQLVPFDAWVDGPPGTKLAIRRAHREPGKVGFVLIERDLENHFAKTGLVHDHAGRDWPAAQVRVLVDNLAVLIAGKPALSRPLEAPSPIEL